MMRSFSWFTQDDVEHLVSSTKGCSLLANAKPAVLANALDEAFKTGSFFAQILPSSKQELLEIANIKKCATELLKALGYQSRQFPIPSKKSRRIRGSKSDVHGRLIRRFSYAGRMTDSHRWYSPYLQDYVDEARESVSSIIWAAHAAKAAIPDDTMATGRRPSTGLDAFYRGLAPVFLAMFGIHPSLSGKQPTATDSGVLWSQAIIKILYNRSLGQQISEDDKQLLRALATIKEPVAHAKRMREGWKSWIALSPEERWRPDIWMNMKTGARVPEWVPKSAIPAP